MTTSVLNSSHGAEVTVLQIVPEDHSFEVTSSKPLRADVDRDVGAAHSSTLDGGRATRAIPPAIPRNDGRDLCLLLHTALRRVDNVLLCVSERGRSDPVIEFEKTSVGRRNLTNP